MNIIIKPMETNAEIRGKAYVHWKAWQEAYAGLIDADYLASRTLESAERTAFRYRDRLLVALDGERVVGFAGYGPYRDDTLPDTGEVYALYILKEYYGQGVGRQLMDAAMARLNRYSRIALWVLKNNVRAIRFYRKCGFEFDGAEEILNMGTPATEVRMCRKM